MSRNMLVKEIGEEDFKAVLTNYPIWNENQRASLNDYIYNYFLYWQISIHNKDVWLHTLKMRMFEIMPRLNTLYSSYDLMEKFDPLRNYEGWIEYDHVGQQITGRDTGTTYSETGTDDRTTTLERKENQNTARNTDTTYSEKTTDDKTINLNKTENQTTHEESTEDRETNTSNTHNRYFSDTPQGNLTEYPEKGYVSLEYLSDYTHETDSTKETMHDEKSTDGTMSDTIGQTETTDDTTTKNSTTNVTDKYEMHDGVGQTEVVDDDTTKNSNTKVRDDYQSDDTATNNTHDFGMRGTTYQSLVQEYRDLALSVDELLVQELDDLFATSFDVKDLAGSETPESYELPWPLGSYHYF